MFDLFNMWSLDLRRSRMLEDLFEQVYPRTTRQSNAGGFPPITSPHLAGLIPEHIRRDEVYKQKVGKTPLWAIATLLRSVLDMHIAVSSVNEMAKAGVGAFLLEGVLNDHIKPDTPGHHCRHYTENQARLQFVSLHGTARRGRGNEKSLTTYILYIPSAGCFYTYFGPFRHRNVYCVQRGSNTKLLAPTPATFLRIKRDGSDMAKRGFLKDIKRVFWVTTAIDRDADCYPAYGYPLSYVFNVPDKWILPNGQDDREKNQDWAEPDMDATAKYKKLLRESSTSANSHQKHIVRNLIFKTPRLQRRIYHVDARRRFGYTSIRVVHYEDALDKVEKSRTFLNRDQSTVNIGNIQAVEGYHALENASWKMMEAIDSLPSSMGVCREGDGMLGNMWAIGEHVHNGTWKEYSATDPLYRRMGKHNFESFLGCYRNMMRLTQPLILSALSAHAKYFGVPNSIRMRGSDGILPSMILTRNLANPPHYDPMDLGPSYCIWMEKKKGVAQNWRFFFPQLLCRVDGVTYHGLMVDLGQGSYISWDGMLRHCTPECLQGPGNAVYAYYVGVNLRSVSQYLRAMEGQGSHGNA